MIHTPNPASELWRKMEAEGRLRERIVPFVDVDAGNWAVGPDDARHKVYWSLRLTDDECKRLLYPSVMSITNLEICGEA